MTQLNSVFFTISQMILHNVYAKILMIFINPDNSAFLFCMIIEPSTNQSGNRQ